MINDLCAQAATTYGHTFHRAFLPQVQKYEENDSQASAGCILKQIEKPIDRDMSTFVGYQHELSLCDPNRNNCQCAVQSPCFCMSNYFVEIKDTQPLHRRRTQVNGQFLVTWSLSLGGNEFLLESAFLRAAFEQSVKEYINNNILCSDDLSLKGVEFFGVEIENDSVRKQRILKAVSGNVKCHGDVNKCKIPIKLKRKKVADDDVFRNDDVFRDDDDNSVDKYSNLIKTIKSSGDFCENFLKTTIFDAFDERLLTASAFNYNVNVDVISDLQGSLDLKYNVLFEPAPTAGLNQIEDVDAIPNEPVPISDICAESQCITQSQVIQRIYQHFELSYDANKHECLYQGINCNTRDMITHIWMGK